MNLEDFNKLAPPFDHPGTNRSLGDSTTHKSDTYLHVSGLNEVEDPTMPPSSGDSQPAYQESFEQLYGGTDGNTFSMGTDLSGMAERARELGLENRAKQLMEEDRSRVWDFSRVLDRILINSGDRVSVRMIKRLAKLTSDVDDDDDEDDEKRLNLTETIAAIVKATVGSAVLYVPNGYAISGYTFAPPMLAFAYILVAWSSYNLLSVWQNSPMSFASLMGKAIGRNGERLVQFMIVCLQCGICLSYFIFFAKNIIEVSTHMGFDMSLQLLCVLQLFIYIPMTFIRNIQKFAIFNFLANVLIFSSLLMLSAYAAVYLGTTEVHEKLMAFNEVGAVQFIGTCMFIFEGVMALCIPIQEAVEPHLVAEFPKIFITVLGVIMAAYILFGYLNYTAYGADTQLVLTSNLPEGSMKCVVQIAFAFAIVFTFPLQLFPAIGVLESVFTTKKEPLAKGQVSYQAVDSEGADSKPSVWKGNIARGFLVLLLGYTAVINVEKLEKIVSLLGSLFGVPLGCVFPSFIHLKLATNQADWVGYVNMTVVVVGTVISLALSINVLSTW